MFELNRIYTLKMAQGVISQTGINLLIALIGRQDLQDDAWKSINPNSALSYLPPLPYEWDWLWVVRKGVYAGTMPKRVSRYYHKIHGLNCPTAFLEQIGNTARSHSESNVKYAFEFTDTFDWNAGDFGDYGSCYFGGRSEAREILADNGGLAIRFYRMGKGFARAWVVPIEDGMHIIFNGYGLQTLEVARIFSQFVNAAYKRIDLSNWGVDDGTLWINGGTGYVIGATEAIEPIADYDFQWGEDETRRCESCGDAVNEDDVQISPDGDYYCQNCFDDRFGSCCHCGETHYHDDLHYADDCDYCEYFLDRLFTYCEECNEYVRNERMTEVNGNWYCEDCAVDIEPDEPEGEQE
jgi:hypothetical protein